MQQFDTVIVECMQSIIFLYYLFFSVSSHLSIVCKFVILTLIKEDLAAGQFLPDSVFNSSTFEAYKKMISEEEMKVILTFY